RTSWRLIVVIGSERAGCRERKRKRADPHRQDTRPALRGDEDIFGTPSRTRQGKRQNSEPTSIVPHNFFPGTLSIGAYLIRLISSGGELPPLPPCLRIKE